MREVSPSSRDLGGFSVRRILPTVECRSIGPFVFFDELGPLMLKTGLELEVRPHPHIGLATLTWLFSGAMMHRDSLGSVQVIHPGAVNLMTAGRGIVHSERVSQSGMTIGQTIHGAQFWLALPKADEDRDPRFDHHPDIQGGVVIGEWQGTRSPVRFPHPALCVDLRLQPGESLAIPTDLPERGVYVVSGTVLIEGVRHEPHRLLVLEQGARVTLEAAPDAPAHLLLIAGEPFPEPRHLDWNFVATSRERLAAAKQDWRGFDTHLGTARFPQVPGETEFIPLP